MCPPVREQTSTILARRSDASSRSSSRLRERTSAGAVMRSRMDMEPINLRGALDGEARNLRQGRREQPDRIERITALADQGLGPCLRAMNAEHCRICAFPEGQVAN